MSPELKHDLERLQQEHAVDESLIESLLASKKQARAHIKFWVQMMWAVNGGLIGTLALCVGWTLRWGLHGGPLWLWGICGIASLSLLIMMGVLQQQRRAAQAIKETACKHHLI